ncbi:hypothetical protein AGOR_G00001540 [Albula goreensis]|uniref:Uncharacterized protein n=1 Tax=Albula goreensis TaxID=1534307 RepID=A0A8T3EA59_9TELE|nr:hypothetical protein AGOR_G00001540 [Albula goreensis]
MVRIKELQRRLDQSLGKITLFQTSSERTKDKGTNTVGSRLNRMEEKMHMDQTLQRICDSLNILLARSGPSASVGQGPGLGGGAAGQGGASHMEMFSLPTYEQLSIPTRSFSQEESS